MVDGRVPLLIEIKNEGDAGEMEGLVYEELKRYQGQYAIQSFNPYSVKWFRDNAPNVVRGQLSGSLSSAIMNMSMQVPPVFPGINGFCSPTCC